MVIVEVECSTRDKYAIEEGRREGKRVKRGLVGLELLWKVT